MKIFKYIICIIIVSLFTLNLFSQEKTQAEFLSELDNKDTATYGDALAMFSLQSGGAISVNSISEPKGYSLQNYEEGAPLTTGMASLMTVKYLNLDGSFMYLLFGTERYAYKACVSNNLFNKNGSENEKMTGLELIELFSRISDIKEVK